MTGALLGAGQGVTSPPLTENEVEMQVWGIPKYIKWYIQLILQLLHFTVDISHNISQIICFSNKKSLLNILSQC